MGESGTVAPDGKINNRQYTLGNTVEFKNEIDADMSIFYLPLVPRIDTMYTAIGFIFDYLLAIAGIVVIISAFVPQNILSKCIEMK